MAFMIFNLLLTFVTAVVFGELKKECPLSESVPVCFCRTGPVLTCSQISNQQSLLDTLKALRDYRITELTLSNVNATTVPTDLYQGLHIEELTLEKFEVKDSPFRPNQPHFSGLEQSLHTLEIRKSFRKGNPLLHMRVDHLKHLNVVLLEDNEIPEVGNDWFPREMESLSTLIFERNGIEVLGPRAFHWLKNLRTLAVAGNHLRDVSRTMLPSPALHLSTLDLAYNKIRDLPIDLFKDMPALRDVNVGYNLIHTVPEDTWSLPLWTLTKLVLEGNPLNCDASVNWLCKSRIQIIAAKCLSPVDKRGLTLKNICEI